MYFIKYFFVCWFFTYKTAFAENKETIKVSLYYESFCPFSAEFITEQLYPGYEKLQESLILDLVPFGKANKTFSDGKWNFQCQHGPKECLGNKIQACVLGKAFSNNDKMAFVNCMMNSTDPASNEIGKFCAEENRLRWLPVFLCSQSYDGDRLLAHFGNKTDALSPKLQYVPHILFDGIFNETLENDARNDFFQTACSLFTNKPQICNDE